MNSEISTTPPPDADELPRPGFWPRVAAWLIDVVLMVAVSVVVHRYVFGIEFPDVDLPEPAEPVAANNAEFVVNAVINFFYFGIMHGRFGKTVGKALCRFHVAGMDGSRVGYWTAFVRAFWFTGILAVIELPRLLYPDAGLDLLSDLGALYVLFNALCLVWDQKFNRALHDRLAGTRVILDKPAPLT